jgi:prevent-host-death family protein
MDITVKQFKATCSGIIEQIQKEKSRITITQHGRPVAELIPITSNHSGKIFGRSKQTTLISGDILNTGESWHA